MTVTAAKVFHMLSDFTGPKSFLSVIHASWTQLEGDSSHTVISDHFLVFNDALNSEHCARNRGNRSMVSLFLLFYH